MGQRVIARRTEERCGLTAELGHPLHGEFLALLGAVERMPGYPTHIVGTPTIRGKAQRYKGSREDRDRSASCKEGLSRPTRPLNLPGVNHGQRQILEMLGVPRRQGCTVCKNNPGNHRVAHLC